MEHHLREDPCDEVCLRGRELALDDAGLLINLTRTVLTKRRVADYPGFHIYIREQNSKQPIVRV